MNETLSGIIATVSYSRLGTLNVSKMSENVIFSKTLSNLTIFMQKYAKFDEEIWLSLLSTDHYHSLDKSSYLI